MAHDGERPTRPLLLPETYSGEGNLDDWIAHFENVAAINGWDNAAKLQWLSVRMIGRAQTAFRRFPEAARADYAAAKAALIERFEPPAKKDLYATEFQNRKKGSSETWGDFADALKTLVERAFPTLQAEAKETLALNQYLSQIHNQQLVVGVKQRHPKNLVEAVSFTIEMESYFLTPAKLAPVIPEESSLVSAVQSQQGAMLQALEGITQQLQRLEFSMREEPRSSGQRKFSTQPKNTAKQSRDQPVICYKCKQEGHYARGCAYRGTSSGN